MTSKDEQLPPNWTKHFSNTHKTIYYFNKTNGKKSWVKPLFESQATTSKPTVANSPKPKFTNIVKDTNLIESVGKKFQKDAQTPAQNRLKRLQDSLKKDKMTPGRVKTTLTTPTAATTSSNSPKTAAAAAAASQSKISKIPRITSSKSKLFNKSPKKLLYSNSQDGNIKNESSIRKRKHTGDDGGSGTGVKEIIPIKKMNTSSHQTKLNEIKKLKDSPSKKTTEILSTNRITDKNIRDTEKGAKSPAQNRLKRLQHSFNKNVKPATPKTSLETNVNNKNVNSSALVKNLSNKSIDKTVDITKKARRPSVTDDEDDNFNDNQQISNNINKSTINEEKPADIIALNQPQSIFGGVFQWAKSFYSGTIRNPIVVQKETENNCININKEAINCPNNQTVVINNPKDSILSSNDKLCAIDDVIMTDDDNSIGSDDSMDWDDVIIPQKQPEEPTSSSLSSIGISSVIETPPPPAEITLTDLQISKINSVNDRLKNINPTTVNHKKIYIVVDTNIFISNLYGLKQLIKKINENKNIEPQPIIVLPYVVLKELDKLKTLKDSSVSVLAKIANRYVNEEFKKTNGIIKGQSAKDHNRKLIEIDSCDDEIINCCLQLKENDENNIELLSNDVNLQNKAMCSGFKATSLFDLGKQFNFDTTNISK